MTVNMTDKVVSTMVNNRYFPINGITNDVDGIISTVKQFTILKIIYETAKNTHRYKKE